VDKARGILIAFVKWIEMSSSASSSLPRDSPNVEARTNIEFLQGGFRIVLAQNTL